MNPAIARRRPDPHRVASVRDLTPADLENLRLPSHRIAIKSIRERHHQLARLIAAGLTGREIASRLGMTENRISVLRSDPSIRELIATYRSEVHTSWREHIDAVQEFATSNLLTAERMIADRLEDADITGEPLPMRDLLALTADRMDRFGYGKHATNTNINVDFAKRLEDAIARSRKAAE
jgi:DNA-binding CsgD family transcriptional regulator